MVPGGLVISNLPVPENVKIKDELRDEHQERLHIGAGAPSATFVVVVDCSSVLVHIK